MKKVLMGMMALVISLSCFASSSFKIIKEVEIPEKGNLIELIKEIDPKVLKSEDESKIQEALIPTNKRIIYYLSKHYDVRLDEQFEENDSRILLIGLHVAVAERSQAGQILDCFMQGIGIIAGGEAIAGLIGNLSTKAVLALAKNVLTKFVPWLGLAVAVWNFGDCMGYW